MKGYRHIATQGALWNMSLALLNKGITFAGQIVLAWLLMPADVGSAGMAIAVTGFTAFLSTGSLGDVLIQRGKIRKELGQGLWLSFGLSLATSLFILMICPFTKLFHHQELSGLLTIIALSVAVSGFNPVLGAKLKNNLDFKNLAITHLLEGATYTSFSIFFASLGFGPYSLVLPLVPKVIVAAGYMVWKEGWPVYEFPNLKLIKVLIPPTAALAVTVFFMGLQTQAPIFFAGLKLNSTEIGYFAWGWSVASQTVFLLAVNLRQVLFPIFVKLGDNKENQIRAAFKTAWGITAVLSIACGLQALVAQPLLNQFLPVKWNPAGFVITSLSLGLGLQGIWISATSLLNAVGKYRDLLWVSIIPTLLASGAAYFGASINGYRGAAIGTAISILAGTLFSVSRIPWGKNYIQIKQFIFPIIITSTIWMISYCFCESGLLVWQIFGCSLFALISCLAWWHWGGEEFKKLLMDKLKTKNG